MFHLSKLQIKGVVALGLIGTVVTGGYFFANLLGFSAIAQEPTLSAADSADLTPLLEWFEAGSDPQDYAMGADRTITYNGVASGSVQALNARSEGFGTLMQVFDSSAYHGQRLRLRGYVKTENVGDWASLWMRVDGLSGAILGFDNMQNRAIQGTTD